MSPIATPVPDDFDPTFLGSWVSRRYRVRYSIRQAADALAIGGRDLADGEVFEVSDVSWADGRLGVTFRMPSTGQVTRSSLTVVDPDTLEDAFEGDAMGVDRWTRHTPTPPLET